ncbi:MAG: prolyl oligopeptidase family serine peptidase [Lentimicrobium sp.]|nr:prolyl oligopeptidase family serine peptidase [Lentimicrobium sp.]
MKHLIFLLAMTYGVLQAQTNLPYQLPPKEILDLVDIKPQPFTRIDSRNRTLVMLERQAFKTLEEMAEEEVRVAGLRINPATNGPSRVNFTYGISITDIATGNNVDITGLPEKLKISDFSFSPDEKSIAFTNTLSNGIELWTINLETLVAQKLINNVLNGSMGFSYEWMPNSQALIVLTIPENREKLSSIKEMPIGPAIQETTGRKAPVRTYQDLLRNAADEAMFDHYVHAVVQKVNLDGNQQAYLPEAIYRSLEFSPDGNYLMVQTIERPYSYIVPSGRFPVNYSIYTANGKLFRAFYKKPLIEELPTGFGAVETGKRSIGWRNDAPSTLTWVEAIDGGDPSVEVDFRDEVFMLEAPFDGIPVKLASTRYRFAGINWGRNDVAMLYDYWWKTRKSTCYLIDPSKPEMKPRMIFDRSTEDYYGDPGNFLLRRNNFDAYTLWFSDDGKKLYLTGQGYSPEGNKPFLDEFTLKTSKIKRLWQADGISTYENIVRVVDPRQPQLITSIQAKTINPNFFMRTGKNLRPLSHFPHPYASFMGISKEQVHYKRADGVDLSATLYLPAGYDKERDGRLPTLMWAYPREFKDAEQAGQIKESPHTFVQLYYGSPVYWAARGYAIIDDADFPIIGEGETEPNDYFVEQLVSNAAAAIDYATALGVTDPERVAIGGHSYGAFMTANLMAHCDLFAAGIARSGAYNRTLTPFGFQSEERTFWENPEIYLKMSPFVNADKINEPLLLIHGDADNNPGTFTLQSERLFSAIKGLGGTARLVLLPFESHGYSARENVMHMLWETDEWLEKYVKNIHLHPER